MKRSKTYRAAAEKIDARRALRPAAGRPARQGDQHHEVRRDRRGRHAPRRRPAQGRPDGPRHRQPPARHRQDRPGPGLRQRRARPRQATRRRRRHRRRRRPDRRRSTGGWLDFDAVVATPGPDGQGRPPRPGARPAWPDAQPEDRHGHPGRRQGRLRHQGRQDRVPRRPPRQPALHHRQGLVQRGPAGRELRRGARRGAAAQAVGRQGPLHQKVDHRHDHGPRHPGRPQQDPWRCSRTPRRSPPDHASPLHRCPSSSQIGPAPLRPPRADAPGRSPRHHPGPRVPADRRRAGLRRVAARPRRLPPADRVERRPAPAHDVRPGAVLLAHPADAGRGHDDVHVLRQQRRWGDPVRLRVAAVPALRPAGPDLRRRRHPDLRGDRPDATPSCCPTCRYLALPPAKGLPRSKPWVRVSREPRDRSRARARPRRRPAAGRLRPGPVAGSAAGRRADARDRPVLGRGAARDRAPWSGRPARGGPARDRPDAARAVPRDARRGRCAPCSSRSGSTPEVCRCGSGPARPPPGCTR